MQSDVAINETAISGTLHYVKDYTGFSSDDSSNDGNFLALTFNAPEDATVTVTFIGANTTPSPVVLEPGDRSCVFRISNKDTQSIKAEFVYGDENQTVTYTLIGLVLEEDPDPDPEA